MDFRCFSSLPTALYRRVLIRGSLLGFMGLSLLLFTGLIIPTHLIDPYGKWLAIAALLLISIGMLPVRKLQRLYKTPHFLSFNGQQLIFHKFGKMHWGCEAEEIQSMSFFHQNNRYGLKLSLKDQATYYFPYFSEKSVNSLIDNVMHPQETN